MVHKITVRYTVRYTVRCTVRYTMRYTVRCTWYHLQLLHNVSWQYFCVLTYALRKKQAIADSCL